MEVLLSDALRGSGFPGSQKQRTYLTTAGSSGEHAKGELVYCPAVQLPKACATCVSSGEGGRERNAQVPSLHVIWKCKKKKKEQKQPEVITNQNMGTDAGFLGEPPLGPSSVQ